MQTINTNMDERANLTWFYPRICIYQDKINNQEDYFRFLESETESRELSIYIHIPFCDSFCSYCACFKELSALYKEDEKMAYVKAIVKEMQMYSNKPFFRNKEINYIQFGGGTPSCLSVDMYKVIFEGLHSCFTLSESCHISLEGNVMTLKDMYKLKGLKDLGVDRLSFGLQTFNERIRKELNIKAKVSEIFEATENIREVGFESLAVDLMYNLPDENLDILKNDLEMIVGKIKPDYIQTYRFNQFHNTVLQKKISNGYFSNPPSGKKEFDMFAYILEFLKLNGYDNHVLINLFSNKKSPIPTGLEYTMGNNKKSASMTLGIGAGASSFLNKRNYKSVCSVKKYIELISNDMFPVEAGNIATEEVLASRTMVYFPNFMQIRKTEIPNDDKYTTILNELVQKKYIIEHNDRYELSRLGIMWAGDISKLFFADEEIEKNKKSVYYSIKNNTNPFNQDKMNMANKNYIKKEK